MIYTVYAILSSRRNYIYVGMTDNLDRRFNEHNAGLNKTTAPYAPYVVIFTENIMGTRKDARKEKSIGKVVREKDSCVK
jgi:putative endonuclease